MRRVLASLVGCLLATSTLSAAEPPIPEDVAIELKWTAKKVTDLPAGVDPTCAGMMPEPTENPEAEVRLAELDLNRDGSPELLVDYPAGGTGGGYSMIYRRKKGEWSEIAFLQGGLTFHKAYQGYLRISVTGSGGGGHHAVSFLRFERGEYRTYRIDRYYMGEYRETEYPHQ